MRSSFIVVHARWVLSFLNVHVLKRPNMQFWSATFIALECNFKRGLCEQLPNAGYSSACIEFIQQNVHPKARMWHHGSVSTAKAHPIPHVSSIHVFKSLGLI